MSFASFEQLIEWEEKMHESLGWPTWTLRTIEVFSIAILILFSIQTTLGFLGFDYAKEKSHHATKEFRLFQLKYLLAYLIIMLADWLQGTNMYTLYMV
jgi:hypothetical protein